MLLKWEIYWPLLDFMTLVALFAYQHPQLFFFFYTLVICFIGKTLSKRRLCSPPKIHKCLAAFSRFCAVDKGQITDGNVNFHAFSCGWEGGRRADRPQERRGVRVSWRRRRQRLDNVQQRRLLSCSPENPLVNNTHDISTGSI